MAQPYVGEIRMFAGDFSPAGWLLCEGQLLSIAEYETLFNLIGTTYGGDGQDTYALPDLRGRLPIHQGNNFVLAEMGGVEEVTLTVSQIPAHGHSMTASNTEANSPNPGSNLAALSSQVTAFLGIQPNTAMNAAIIGPVGGSQPHNNLQPYLCVSFIISLFGIFPSSA